MYTNDTCYMYMCITGYYGNVDLIVMLNLMNQVCYSACFSVMQTSMGSAIVDL